MTTKNEFKIDKNNIKFVGDNFKKWFYGMKFIPQQNELTYKTLEKPMTDEEILSELKPQAVTLGDILNAIKTNKDLLRNGYANIFYAKDKDNILRAVDVHWNDWSGGWFVGASVVGYPSRWSDSRQVFSRNFGHSDTLALETLPDQLTINGVIYKRK